MARSYTDPHYDGIEAGVEAKLKLPKGSLKKLRTLGERTNEGVVSSAGARTVYQVTPSTRRLVLNKYKIDAFADDDGYSAAMTAGYVLKEGMDRNGGDFAAGVREYHGGTNPANHGKVNRAYVARVTGTTAGDGYAAPTGPAEKVKDYNGSWRNKRPADMSDRPLPEHIRQPNFEEKRRLTNKARFGAPDLLGVTPDGVDKRAVGIADIREGERAAVEQTIEDNKITPWQRLSAAWQDNSLTATILRNLDDNDDWKPEAGFTDHYLGNREAIEKDMDDDEVTQLRTATSIEHLAHIQEQIAQTRDRRSLYTGRGVGTVDSVLYSLMGGVLDPAGFAAGEGVTQLFRLGGIGSRALYAARRPLMGTVSQAGEAAIGNVAVTGLMDLTGEHYTSKDYAMAAAFGAGIGVAASPVTRASVKRAGEADTAVADMFMEEADNARAEMGELFTRAEANLGPDAAPDQVRAEAARLDRDDHMKLAQIALADQPDAVKVLNGDNVLTSDPAVMADMEARYDLAGISDETERKLVAEMMARSERGMGMIDIDEKRLNPMTRWFGAQSTGIDLLRSKSPVARFVGSILTEGTTGAAGRRRTAALAQHTRERVYNSELRGYAGLYHLYRKEQGVGLASEAIDGKMYSAFEREVFLEIEGRGFEDSYSPHSNPLIREAADMIERGMDKMRIEQQHVGTAGHARLGTTSRGYIPHRLMGTAVLKLTTGQKVRVRSILSEQFQSEGNAFKVADGSTKTMDKEFADKLAAKYLERATDKAKGGYDVPMNLQDPQAADMIEDALQAMGVKHPDIKDMMGKFARAGAGHTKKRLRLDLNADIGDGMKLADLYDTSVGNLYRGYARRVSGEVALGQFGILGRKGLSELRKAIMHSGGDVKELRAFDQVASEFLNMPFGDLKVSNHKYMDNLRIATSLSRLGGMGFTQLSEYGNGISALGAQRVLSSVGDAPRLMAEIRAINKGNPKINPLLKDLDLLGGHLGLDEFVNTRLFEVKDNSIEMYGTESIGLGTRALRAGANAQAILSGHRMIMGVQVRGMSEQIVRKAFGFVRDGLEDKALDDMGIDAALRARLKSNLSEIATWEGGDLMGVDLTKGDLTGHEIMQLRDAVERGASQIIQKTYIGETGIWAHDGLLKVLTQFRTFGITSIEKQWGRQYHTHGLKQFAYLIGAMSWAAPIYMARTALKMSTMDEDEADEYADKHLTPMAIGVATLNYTSSTGLTSDVLDLGLGVAGGAFGIELGDDLSSRGQYRGGAIGGAFAPGVGLINDVAEGVTKGDKDKLLRAMPGANLPFVQPAVSALQND